MKITTLLLIASIMQVSAISYAQKVTYSQKNITVEQLFREITKQTGYNVLYPDKEINTDRRIDVDFNDTFLDKVLTQVFKGLSISYKIENKNIIIKKEDPSFLERLAERWASIDVSGRVVDADGRGLPGASVSVKGKGGKAVSTGADGSFYLKGVDEDAMLVISFIGYVPKEVKAIKELGHVVLELSTSKLDEVQVIAYGTTTRRLSTSNISSIKADQIAAQPVSNPLLAMMGRVPGLQITQSTGIPGGSIKVRIQGQNSLQQGSEPFYVIDGVPYSSQTLFTNINGAVGGSQSALSFINPSDIESIDILKDADATAIYGSRAANGAILITTKKGKVGQTKIDLNIQNGFGKVTRKIGLMSTQQYIEMRLEALKNNNNTPVSSTDYDLNGAWDRNQNTDWQQELIGGTAHYTNIQTNLSGGNEQTQFLAGASYNRESTVFPGSYSDVKANVHVNINHTSSNQRFKFNLTNSYQQDLNKLPTIDLTGIALNLAPNSPYPFKPDGSVNWGIVNGVPTFTTNNPAAVLLQKFKGKTNNLISSSTISYEIFPGLQVKSNLGYNRLETQEVSTTPQTSFSPTLTRNNRKAKYGTNYVSSWIIEPQIAYNKDFSWGHLDALIGSTFQNSDNAVDAFDGSLFANDSQLENSRAAGTIVASTNTMQSKYRYSAIFGRLNYRFRDRYILNSAIRRDGSSRFGIENMFNTFYSVGGAWILSEEEYLKRSLSYINHLKLKVTYGTAGNDQINNYEFLSLYQSYTPNGVPYQSTVGLLPTKHSNPYLQWEVTKKLNFGLDLGVFNNRLLFSGNYAINRSSNQLTSYPLPVGTGFSGVLINLPATVQNTSWEFLLDASIVNHKAFSWQSSFNLTIPKNKLINYPDFENSAYYNTLIVGQSLGIKKLYQYAGVNPTTGYYEFNDHSGQKTSTVDPAIDKTQFVDFYPKFYGGLNNTLNFKNFSLDFLVQFVKQIGENYQFGSLLPGFANKNQPQSLLNRWHNISDISNVQQVTTSFDGFDPFNNVLESTAHYSDASFIRLKNLNLSYNLPPKLISKSHISKAKLFAQGQNLMTITNFVGLDPENQSTGSMPPLKIFSFGLQLTF